MVAAYLDHNNERPTFPLFLRDSTGRDRALATLRQLGGIFTPAPDGKTILYTKLRHDGSDLMMIDNFR
jgi:hypothetical protein